MRRLLVLPLVVSLHAPLYLEGGFVGDGYLYIQHGARPRSLGEVWDALFSPFLGATAPYLRPVTTLFEIVETRLFGTSTLPYYLLGSLLHATVALLLGEVVFQLARRAGRPDFGARARLPASLLFAVGAVPLDALVEVGARGDVLAGLFSLATIHAALRGRRLVAAGAFALAFLSKETALVVPPLVLVLDLAFPADRARRFAPAAKTAALLFAVLLGGLLLRRGILGVALARFDFLAAAREFGWGRSLRHLGGIALERLGLLHFPLNERAAGPPLRALLLASLLAAEGWSVLAGRPSKILRGVLLTALLVVVAQGPALLVGIDVETLARARFLYVPAAVAAAGGGLLLALPRSRIPALLAVGTFAALAFVNEKPWIRSMLRMERLLQEVEDARTALDVGDEFAVLLDAPGYVDGAIFFQPGTAPAFEPPFLSPPVRILSFTRDQFAEFERVGGEFAAAVERGVPVFAFPSENPIDGALHAERRFDSDPVDLPLLSLLEPRGDSSIPPGGDFPDVSFRAVEGAGEYELVAVSVPRLEIVRVPLLAVPGEEGVLRASLRAHPSGAPFAQRLRAEGWTSERLAVRVEAFAGEGAERRPLARSPTLSVAYEERR